ncbi:MAG: hypothetical protein NZM00_02830 [Anaerolinea sp.]|nr:hypothetical protein [Anaerolinea sp.]
MTSLLDQILTLTPGTQHKTLVLVGAYDDTLARPLADHFKTVECVSPWLTMPDEVRGNLLLRRGSYLEVLENFHRYDVVLVEKAFYRFPDLWQMWTYDRLGRYQELLLVEWDFTGTLEHFHRAFQDRTPLCQIARAVLNRFLAEQEIVIEAAVKGRYDVSIRARSELIEYFRYYLPDHYPFGEKEFLRRTGGLAYPLELWEGFDLLKIRRFDHV